MKQFGVKQIGVKQTGVTALGVNSLNVKARGVNSLSVKQIGVNSLLVLLALLSAVAAPARAMELQKVGEARLEVFIWPVYTSRLYSVDGGYVAGQRPVRLDIEYLRDIDAEDLVSRTQAEWEHLNVTREQRQRWLARLAELWPDVAEGDVLSMVVDDSNASTFYRNGELLGTLEDPDFGQRFLDIWLSPDTSRPELRLALLGKR